MPQCTTLTKRGRRCPIQADRKDANGRWVCHVHDPNGKAAQDRALLQAEKLDRKRQRRSGASG